MGVARGGEAPLQNYDEVFFFVKLAPRGGVLSDQLSAEVKLPFSAQFLDGRFGDHGLLVGDLEREGSILDL